MKKVLIVDDEPDIVEFIDYNLTQQQFETYKAYDGPSAVLTAKKEQPDLILSTSCCRGSTAWKSAGGSSQRSGRRISP